MAIGSLCILSLSGCSVHQREYFAMHGIPEEIATDGGPTYMAYETQKFLKEYGVRHRVSSVAYPHSNQRAELAVKSMKRL